MSFASTALADGIMWGALQLAEPLPNLEAVKPHVNNAVQIVF